MSPPKQEQDYHEKIKSLEEENKRLRQKFEDLKNLDEELTAKKIYDLAYKRIINLVTFGGILTLLVGWIGYEHLMSKADAVVSKMDSTAVLNMANTEIDRKLIPQLKSKLLNLANNKINHITDSINPILTQQIKDQVTALTKPITLSQQEASKIAVGDKTVANVSLPTSVDISNGMGPVRNEGNEGSVVGFASASAMEYMIWKQQGKRIIISPRYIYNSVKIGNGDNGAFIKDAIKFLNKTGAVEESVWPYVSGHYADPPPPAVATATHYKIKEYSKIEITLKNFKLQLSKRLPIIAGVTFTLADQGSAVSQTGILPVYNSGDQIIGGHAICIVGYDDSRQLIKFKNCWGADWGDHGYGYIPYQNIQTSIFSDAFVIKSIL